MIRSLLKKNFTLIDSKLYQGSSFDKFVPTSIEYIVENSDKPFVLDGSFLNILVHKETKQPYLVYEMSLFNFNNYFMLKLRDNSFIMDSVLEHKLSRFSLDGMVGSDTHIGFEKSKTYECHLTNKLHLRNVNFHPLDGNLGDNINFPNFKFKSIKSIELENVYLYVDETTRLKLSCDCINLTKFNFENTDYIVKIDTKKCDLKAKRVDCGMIYLESKYSPV